MTDTEITRQIRLMVMEERARLLAPEDIAAAKTDAIGFLADLLVSSAPEFFEKNISLQAKETNIPLFELPSDYLSLKAVWDYDDNAGSVTGAADNGSGEIRLTVVAHGRTDEDIVTVHDVGGCTEANGQWQIDYIDVDNFDLVGSVWANAWTAGGKVFRESTDTYKYPVTRKPSKFKTASDETHFFLKEDDIVIDDPDFQNDLIVLYKFLPSTLAEIPARMHFGIWAYATVSLIHVPAPQVQVGGGMSYDPNYNTLKKNLEFCQGLWTRAQDMAMNFNPVIGTNNISDQRTVKRWL